MSTDAPDPLPTTVASPATPATPPVTPPVGTLSPRRRLLLDAALQVVTADGLRGLTHRGVDRRAGVPEGSCSAYWRTRHALLAALTEYVAASLLADIDELTEHIRDCGPDDEQAAVTATLDLFLRWLDQRGLLVARFELTVAGTRDPELALAMADHRSRLIAIVEEIMTATGKEHCEQRAEALVASYDGILLAALLQPASERREFLARSLELIGTALAASPQP